MAIANIFQSLKPLFKETYSKSLTSPMNSNYWKKIKQLLKPKK